MNLLVYSCVSENKLHGVMSNCNITLGTLIVTSKFDMLLFGRLETNVHVLQLINMVWGQLFVHSYTFIVH